MKKFCRYCGKEINENAAFCRFCGKSLINTNKTTDNNGTGEGYITKPYAPGGYKNPTAVRTPQTQPVPVQPMYVNPTQKPPKKKKKKGKAVAITFVSLLLVAALFVCFIKPGFLTSLITGEPNIPTTNLDEYVDISNEDLSELMELEETQKDENDYEPAELSVETSPLSPKVTSVRYSAEDYINAPSTRSEISLNEYSVSDSDITIKHNDEFIVNDGDITVEFYDWNLENETDTLTIKRLPKKHDNAKNTDLIAYDFSLGSGQHEFLTSNTITIPRTAKADQSATVLYYNEQSDEWESVPYERSEDGKSYNVYINHFSTIAEEISYLSGSNMSILFQQVPGDEERPPSMRRVVMTDESYENYLNSEISNTIEAATKGFKTMDAAEGLVSVVNTGLVARDANVLRGVVNQAIMANKLGEVKSGLHLFGSKSTSLKFGATLVGLRIIAQIYNGKSAKEIFDSNKIDIAVLGAQGIAVAVGAVAFAEFIAAAYVVYSVADIYKSEAPPDDEDVHAKVYYEYMNNNMLTINGYKGLNSKLGQSGGFYDAMKDIYIKNEGRIDKIGKESEKLVDDYINYFWDQMSIEERVKEYHRYLMKGLGTRYSVSWEDVQRFGWSDPKKDDIDKYKAAYKKFLQKKTNSYIRKILYDNFQEQKRKTKDYLNNEVVPELNRPVKFLATDCNLDKKQTFDKSPYAFYNSAFSIKDYYKQNKIYFNRPTKSYLFMPLNANTKDYGPEAFTPYPRKDNNTLYACTVYHYYQMGAPTSVHFEGKGKDDPAAPTTDIEMAVAPKPEKNYIVIELRLNDDSIFGDYDIVQKNNSFGSSLTDDIIGLMPDEMGDYIDIYSSYMSDYNNMETKGVMKIWEDSDEIINVSIIYDSVPDQVSKFKGTYDPKTKTLVAKPQKGTIGGEYTFKFKIEKGKITCECNAKYSDYIVDYDITIKGTKRSYETK
ncbi:MAG: zinc-ribbon domain-containing protein [Clostridiales bacterium]|nr:zinc-ribbon domain-containing protein [Clostridiales bacterium]